MTTNPTERRLVAHPGWHVLGAGLVGAWLVVLALMFWPTADGTADAIVLDYAELGDTLDDEELWFGAYQQGRKLGYLHRRVERTAEGYEWIQRLKLNVSVAGLPQAVESLLHLWLNEDVGLQRFAFQLRAGPIALGARGQTVDAGLTVELDLGGERRERIVPLDQPPLFDLALPRLLARQPLRAGARYALLVFDPQTLTNSASVVEVVGPDAISSDGELVPTVHLRRQVSGLQLDSWIDSDGRLIKEQLQGGLLLVREDRERAQSEVVGLDATQTSQAGAEWLRALLPRLDRTGGVTP